MERWCNYFVTRRKRWWLPGFHALPPSDVYSILDSNALAVTLKRVKRSCRLSPSAVLNSSVKR